MGYFRMSLPSLRVVMMFALATILIVHTSTTNASCETLNCETVSSAACRFCFRRGGKRSENYAWRDDRELDNSKEKRTMTSECYLDKEVASLPQDLQEQVFEVLEVLLAMNR